MALLAVSLLFPFPIGALADSYSVESIDLDPGQVLGANPVALGFNTTTKKLYVASGNGVISIYNGTTDTLITALRVGSFSDGIVDSVSNRVYLIDPAGFLVVIDGATDTVAARIPVGTAPRQAAVHPTNGRVYVTNFGVMQNAGDNTVSVIIASTNSVEATVTVGKNPTGIGFNGNDVYIANEGSGNVSVIDADPANTSTFNTVVAAITISSPTADWGPAGVAVNGTTHTVYILNRGNHGADVRTSFAVIDGATRALADLGVDGLGAPIRNPVLVPNTYWSTGIAVRESTNTVGVRNSRDIDGNELHTYSIWSATAKSWVAATVPAEDIGGPITAWARCDSLQRLYLLANGSIHVVNVNSADTMNFAHVVATVPFYSDSTSGRALALDDADGVLYVAGGQTNSVAVIDLSDNSWRQTYFTGGGPALLSVDSTRNAVWVGHNGGGLNGSLGVRRIDGATRTVTSLDTGPGSGYLALLNEPANWVYSINWSSGAIGLLPIDGADNTIAAAIPLGISEIYGGLALNETAGRFYVLNHGTLHVVNIDAGSPDFHSVEATVTIGGSDPQGLAVNKADNWIYVGNEEDAFISAVNGATNTVAATIPVGPGSDQIAINQSTKRAYISSDGDLINTAVRVIDVNPANTATFNTVIETIPIAAISENIAVNETTNRIYVDIDGNGTIGVLDGADGTVEATIPVPGSQSEKILAIDEGLGRIYALDPGQNKVHIIDGNPGSALFNTILESVDVGWWPVSIGVNTSTHEVFVANSADNTVSVITPEFTTPGAPAIGTATAGFLSATVSFGAPASDGGSAIFSYTVTSDPDGLTATGAGSPLTVTGLTPGLSYSFTVRARNAAGFGPASGTSNSVTPIGPGSISGRVTDMSGNPQLGFSVIVTGGPCDSTTYIAHATTNALGFYTVSGLPPGEVYAHTRDSAFSTAFGWYDGVYDCELATPVTVLADQDSPDIDFSIAVGITFSRISTAQVFSENIQYDPVAFPAAQGQPYVNGTPYWRMLAIADVNGNGFSTHPVTLESGLTGSRELQYVGAFGVFTELSAYHFNDFNHPVYGGPFTLPGAAWEDESYLFSVGNARAYFFVPTGSIQQIPIPQNVSISTAAQPVISWDAVPGADRYQVWIYTLNGSGYPDHCIFMSPGTTQLSYTYTGDLFAQGGGFAIRVNAVQWHPYRRAGDPYYSSAISNRSSFLTRYDVNRPPTLDAISNLTIAEAAGLQTVSLTGITAGAGESQSLVVTAVSSNTGLIPNPTVNYASPNASGSLTFTPAAAMSGAATIFVTVNDGQSVNPTVVGTFRVTVIGANDPPLPNLAAPFPIAVDVAGEVEISVSAAFDGTNWLAAALTGINNNNWGEIVDQRLSTDGEMVGAGLALGGASTIPVVAYDGTNYLTVWLDDAADPNDILYGRFVSPSGNYVSGPFQIGGGNFLGNSGIAYGGGQYLVVSFREVDPLTGAGKVFGRLVSPAGTVGLELAISSGLGNEVLLNVAFDGANFFTVWTDGADNATIKGRFVNPNGTLGLEMTVNDSGYPSANPTVAFDGTEYLVVWPDEVAAGDSNLYGQRVSAAGVLVGGVIAVNEDPGQLFAPSLAWDGSKWLVAWTDTLKDTDGDTWCDAGEGTCWDVYAQVLSRTGGRIGSPFPISTAGGNQIGAIAGFGGGKFLALIDTLDTLEDATMGNVQGVFVTPGFTVPGAPIIGTATAGNGQATVEFGAPATDGGSAITLYTVTSIPEGKIGTGTTTPVIVTGLTNGTAYTFTVAATNLAGTGPASAESNSVTPTNTHTVTAVAGANGSLDTGYQASPQTVAHGGTTSFKFVADPGYHVASVGGCGISHTNSSSTETMYIATTGAVTGDCTVSATFALHPPGGVTLVAPLGVIVTATPTYTWNALAGADSYQLWVGSGPTTVISVWYTAGDAGCASGSGTCSVTPATALAAQKWSFNVKARNVVGTGPWTTAQIFTYTVPFMPTAITMVSPTGVVGTATPPYTWSAMPTVASYQLWVGMGATTVVSQWYTAAQAGCGSGTGTCSVTPATALAQGKWAFNVKGQNIVGTGPWTTAKNFTYTTATTPTALTLVSPAGVTPMVAPTYTWNALANVDTYLLYVGDGKSSTPIYQWYTAAAAGCASGEPTCSVTPATVLTEGVWYFNVKGQNLAGTSPWATSKMFIYTNATLPTTLTLQSPSGAIGSNSPTYTWDALAGVDSYLLYVGGATTAVYQWYTAAQAGCPSGSGPCAVTPATVLETGSWYFNVRGKNLAGTGPWAAAKRFTAP